MTDKKSFDHPQGMKDILPDDHIYYTFLKKIFRHRCRQSGYRRITTPVCEEIELYKQSIGEETDTFKNLYILKKDKGKYALRTDLITGIARAYIANGMSKLPQPVELYSIETVCRNIKDSNYMTEFCASIIGESDPAIDAQVIYLAYKVLKDLGIIQSVTLEINTLGDSNSRNQYFEDLKNFYYGKEHVLGAKGMKLLESNPLRLLTSDNEDWQILAKIAPKLDKVLSKECKDYHKKVLEYIDELEVEYKMNENSIPDNTDYFTDTIFQFVCKETGKVILRGGRYNELIHHLGGQKTNAIGFTVSFEDLIGLMKKDNITIKSKDTVDVFVAQLGTEAKKKALWILMKLREAGVHAMGALGKGSMKEQLSLAKKFNASWTVIMGQIEVLEGIVIIRNMSAGSQEIVRLDDAVDEVIERVGEDNLDQYSVGIEEIVMKGEEKMIGEEYEEYLSEGEVKNP